MNATERTRTATRAAEATDEELRPSTAIRRRRLLSGIRTRILFWSIVTLTFTTAMALIVVRQVLLSQVDSRIDDALAQEARELRILAEEGIDPRSGEPFGSDVARIFSVFLQRNVPQRNETYLTFLDGAPFRRSQPLAAHRLDQDPAFVALVRSLERPDRGTYESPAGHVEYLAVPVDVGGTPRGVFVAAFLRDVDVAQVDSATRAATEVGVLTLLIGSLVAWRVAEGVLRPVRTTTGTAREISSADLSRRIPTAGDDEIAELGRAFNDLLEKLEESFEVQRRLVDDAGHELRTPITIIRGHLELLDEDPEERDRTLALVQDELDRMQRIVADLLTLAKVERPDFLAFETVDVARLTEELGGKVRALGGRAWTIEAIGRGIVVADRQRLSQAVIQLAQNAVQHTAAGDEIALGSSVDAGEARFWVRDAGEGIATDRLPMIFGRFSRGGEARRRSDGAGLGLSIVRAITEAHGGRVEVESAVGNGSTFTVVLPIDQPAGEVASRS